MACRVGTFCAGLFLGFLLIRPTPPYLIRPLPPGDLDFPLPLFPSEKLDHPSPLDRPSKIRHPVPTD